MAGANTWTEFCLAVAKYLAFTATNGSASTWEIASTVFPERWARPQGRAAMVGHVDRLTQRFPDDFGRIAPKDQWDQATLFLRTGSELAEFVETEKEHGHSNKT